MNWRKIVPASDAARPQPSDNLIAMLAAEFVPKPHHIHEPTNAALRLIERGRNDPRNGAEGFIIKSCDTVASVDDFAESRDLRQTERTIDIAQPVVVTQFVVLQPSLAIGP